MFRLFVLRPKKEFNRSTINCLFDFKVELLIISNCNSVQR